jgi:ABC-type transporter Mla MlaB component
MMRITETARTGSVVRLRLEGRLMHATPAELSVVVEPDLRTQRTVLLDLAGVSFADASGVACLLELRRRGAVLMACSGLLAEMLRTDVRSYARRVRQRAQRLAGVVQAPRPPNAIPCKGVRGACEARGILADQPPVGGAGAPRRAPTR